MTTAIALAEPLTPDWYEQRRRGIGASEIAAVMGISPWDSPFSLYWKKVEGWETEATDHMSTGTFLEPAIAAWWRQLHADEVESMGQPGLMAHPDRAWQLATLDRIVEWAPHMGLTDGCTRESVLELKWSASWDGWGVEDTDDVPVYYRAQVLWQCDVVGLADWWLAVLGPTGFRQYHGRRDEKDLRVMREYGRRFMARLDVGDPPPIDDHSATLATVKRLHPDVDDTEAEVPADVASGYRRACAMERTAKSAKKRYEALLRLEMGRARKATTGGSFVASRSVYEVDEHTVKTHTVDRLNPPRSKK